MNDELNKKTIEQIKREYYSFNNHSQAVIAWNIIGKDSKGLRMWLECLGIVPMMKNVKKKDTINQCRSFILTEVKEIKLKEEATRVVLDLRLKLKKENSLKYELLKNTQLKIEIETKKRFINKDFKNYKSCLHCLEFLDKNLFNKCISVCDNCRRVQLRKSDNKRLKNPTYKLRIYTSNAIRRGLYKQKGSKLGNSIMKYLPYTIEELRKHIEKLWDPWMNWDNYGTPKKGELMWQIDHIIPQSSLPFKDMKDENFQKCWALNNLRPLEAFKNMTKHNKVL